MVTTNATLQTEQKLDVEEGDTVFLHRTRNAEPRSGFLLGPFVAESKAQNRIVPEAWNHLGDFSWQVRIGWNDPVYSFDVEDYYENNETRTVDLSAYAQHFSEVQETFLTGKVKDGSIIISAN